MNSELFVEVLECLKRGEFDADGWISEGIVPADDAELAYLIEEEFENLLTSERNSFSPTDWVK